MFAVRAKCGLEYFGKISQHLCHTLREIYSSSSTIFRQILVHDVYIYQAYVYDFIHKLTGVDGVECPTQKQPEALFFPPAPEDLRISR